MPSKSALALVIGLSLSATAVADEYRQHSAHVHGHVELNIAQDGKDLLVEVTAPGADVVGFEHAPENAKQEQALKQAMATLEDASALFTINAQAKCQVAQAHATHTLGGNGHDKHAHSDQQHDEHHDHDEHAHHDHDDHHDHDNHNDHEDHGHAGHGEFSVEYRFLCEQVAELSNIKTGWFEHFPGTESISVNLFTDTTQSATRLSKENAQIAIK
ncbi:DUF2796 domain-containing protein [Vibrio sp. CAU 1672]|uniref:zinc uptake protein ZrgA n=1 Tax=Vibrio sp. CAU 1672 TaxID=3032594 RepID=UPI0023DC0A6D|nr:DUF2796 domain-containing protein [Vibrio sp. CAU 1672]MDF2153199.1 DUF2796 domain-containing protein [Vibrio sp. CAU 1672]